MDVDTNGVFAISFPIRTDVFKLSFPTKVLFTTATDPKAPPPLKGKKLR